MTTEEQRELEYAVKQVNYIRENDCDFLTVDTLCAYGCMPEAAEQALIQVMGAEWYGKMTAATSTRRVLG